MRTQKQEFCRNCNKSTLHTREVGQVNNVFHMVLTLLCGCWFPVWMLLLMTRPKYPWMCSVCGHELGKRSERERNETAERKQMTREERVAARAEREAARQDPEYIAAQQAKQEQRQEQRAAVRGTVVAQFKQAVNAADHALALLAGDDQFMHNFFRVLLIGAMLLIGGIVAVIVWNIVF